MRVTAQCTSISDCAFRVYIVLCRSCLSVSYREKVRVGKRCLTTWRRFLVFSKPRKWNQQWRGYDVISTRSFLTAAPRLPLLFCHFLFVCLYFHLSLYLSLCLYLSVSLSLASPHVILQGSRRLLADFFLSFFFLWMGCLVYSLTKLFLSALMMSTYSVTTLTSSALTLYSLIG